MDHTSRISGMLAHPSQRNHDLSPKRSICPGSRNRLGAMAGAAGVLVTAGLGILLAFTATPESLPQSAREFDQETPLIPRSNSPTSEEGVSWTGATPVTESSSTPSPALPVPDSSWPSAASPGSSRPAATSPGPGSRAWLEAVPPAGRAVRSAVPTPVGAVLTSPVPTRPPLVAPPRPAHRPGGRAAPHASPQAPPRVRPEPHPATPPEPDRDIRPAPEPGRDVRPAPEPDRRVAPAPPPRNGMPDPCATFHDFRRQPCYNFLDRLTR